MKKITFELGRLKSAFKTSYLQRKLIFSGDEKYLALTGRQENEPLFAWDLTNQKLKRPPIIGNSFLKFVGPAVGGQHWLIGSGPKIWDLDKNREVTRPGGFKPEPGVHLLRDSYFDHCTDLNPTGERLLGSPLHSEDYYYYNLGLWDVGSGNFIKRFNTPRIKNNNSKVKFSPDGSWFTLAAQLNPTDPGLNITTWDTESGEQISAMTLLAGQMDDFNYDLSYDGRLLAVRDDLFVLDREGPQHLDTLVIGASDSTQSRPISRKLLANQEFMAYTENGTVGVYDLKGSLKVELDTAYKLQGEEKKLTPRVVASSPQHSYYAAADDTVVILWQMNAN